MKIKAAVSDCGREIVKTEMKEFTQTMSFDDVVRMKFLEQSAKYLGVYVENTPDWLDKKSLS